LDPFFFSVRLPKLECSFGNIMIDPTIPEFKCSKQILMQTHRIRVSGLVQIIRNVKPRTTQKPLPDELQPVLECVGDAGAIFLAATVFGP
jgi:hypothetical protein